MAVLLALNPNRSMSTTRRAFLTNATASACCSGFLPSLARPSRTARWCSIGAGGMAYSDIKSTMDHPKVKYVAFCDVDTSHFANVDKEFPGTGRFQDYREMLARLGDKIDAVNISIPDRIREGGVITMQMGKHVYLQKPLTHGVGVTAVAPPGGEVWRGHADQRQIHSAIEYRLGARD